MKKLLIILSIAISACTSVKLDEATAKNKVAELLELIKNQQYEKTKDLYSDTYLESEPIEAKIKKLEEIEHTAGKITSYEFIESTNKELDNENILVLKYNVQCTKTALAETFGVVIEEGQYKIISHYVTNK